MCLTAPVRVVAVDGTVATVELGHGLRRRASTLAVPGVGVGDWALLSSGMLVRLLDPNVAAELSAAFDTATHPQGAPR
ncbi:MAG: HypC/HybG/HupF family hydrogenase formation chaperone [Chloroflexota bacterium]